MLSITLLMAVVVQSRLLILGIHATAHRLSSASILPYLRSSLQPISFTAIAFPLAMSSPCHYRYLPHSTEPIPLVLHHVVLQISSLHRCRFSLSSYPLAHPVAVHLRRTLPPRHELQHPSLTGVRPLERAYCHECVRACCPSNVAACPP